MRRALQRVVRLIFRCAVIVLVARSSSAAQTSLLERDQNGASARNARQHRAAALAHRRAAAVKYQVLYSFKGGGDGWDPGQLTAVNGVLYGTTQFSGSNLGGYGADKGNGTVFKIDTSGVESVLHAFGRGSDGAGPAGGLINVNGVLYGTTTYGGSHQTFASGYYYGGTIFAIDLSGNERVVYSFPSRSGDAASPTGSLIYANDKLYGASSSGGTHTTLGPVGDGALFEVGLNGVERVLYSFGVAPADGVQANDPIDVNGVGYGTTYYGGATGFGTIYEFSKEGERVVHHFRGSDGAYPNGPLLAANGVFYGTTYGAAGSVFTFDGSTVRSIYDFDGCGLPNGNLIMVQGALYGTTSYCPDEYGLIFKLTTSGSLTILYIFGDDQTGGPPQDGISSRAGLVYLNGAFYGTTQAGGSYGFGTVFKLTL